MGELEDLRARLAAVAALADKFSQPGRWVLPDDEDAPAVWVTDLRAALASVGRTEPEACAWCGEPALGVADAPDGSTFTSCLMPQCDGFNQRKRNYREGWKP